MKSNDGGTGPFHSRGRETWSDVQKKQQQNNTPRGGGKGIVFGRRGDGEWDAQEVRLDMGGWRVLSLCTIIWGKGGGAK